MARDPDGAQPPASERDDEPAEGAVRAKNSTARRDGSDDHAGEDAFVEETSRDSFPASDPPAW